MQANNRNPLLHYGGRLAVLLICAVWLVSSYEMILQAGKDYRRFDVGGSILTVIGDIFVALLVAALAVALLYRLFIRKEPKR